MERDDVNERGPGKGSRGEEGRGREVELEVEGANRGEGRGRTEHAEGSRLIHHAREEELDGGVEGLGDGDHDGGAEDPEDVVDEETPEHDCANLSGDAGRREGTQIREGAGGSKRGPRGEGGEEERGEGE